MIDTYTPLYDSLVAELGLIRAAVLCAVLRYCALRDGLCRASQHTIAERLHLSVGSVHKALKQLVAEGYLVDLTPERCNAPHHFRDTGLARPKTPVHDVNAAPHDVNASVQPVNATVHDVQEKKVLREEKERREDSGASAPPLAPPPEII